jgi:hypothetical protein
MEVFIRRPSIDLYPGIRVNKDTVLEYEHENVKQTVKDLVFRCITKIKGEGYDSIHDTTIYLEEGDVLVYESEARGYVKPVESFVSVAEAISDLTNVKDVG